MKRHVAEATRIAVGYALIAAAWILLSDWYVSAYVSPEDLPRLQTYKGIAFVTATSILLFVIVLYRQQALQRSLSQSRRLAQQLARSQRVGRIGSWEVDLARERLTWSDEVFRIFGIEREEFGGTEEAFFSLVHPEDREALREDRRRFLEGEGPLDAVHRIVRPDGGVRWVRERAEVIYGDDGQPAFTAGTVQDITEQVEAEVQVSEQRRLLEIAARIAGVGGWSVELSTGRVRWSDQVARIHGMPPDYSPTIAEGIRYYAPEWRGRVEELFDACVEQARPYDEELQIIDSEGERVWVRVVGEPELGADGEVVRVHGAFVDISEQRETLERVETQARSLRSLARRLIDAQETERRRLARELHDEVGQSLTAASMALAHHRAIDADADTDSGADSEYLRNAQEQLTRVTEQLRAVSLQLSPQLLEQLGLLPAIEVLAERTEATIDARIRLRLTADETRIPRVLRLPCYRIVQEALNNAVRHGEPSQIDVAVKDEDGMLEVSVRDDGRGFDVSACLGVDAEGAGFGLLNMKERAEFRDGEFEVESSPGRGTVVRARFPLTDAPSIVNA